MAVKVGVHVHDFPATVPEPKPAFTAASFRSLRVVDIVTASLLLALGGLVIRDAIHMGIGWGSDGPESGFVPFWLAVVLVVCCAAIVVRTIRRASTARFATREQLACVLKVLLPAVAMILATPLLGLYVSGALYTAFYMRWGGRHSWAFSAGLPLALMVLAFMVFERWFLVPLPKGPLEAWLGY
jgi:hypothetical protein